MDSLIISISDLILLGVWSAVGLAVAERSPGDRKATAVSETLLNRVNRPSKRRKELVVGLKRYVAHGP